MCVYVCVCVGVCVCGGGRAGISKEACKASELSAFCQFEMGGKNSDSREPIEVFDFVWC